MAEKSLFSKNVEKFKIAGEKWWKFFSAKKVKMH
jgi:hypothetical protein